MYARSPKIRFLAPPVKGSQKWLERPCFSRELANLFTIRVDRIDSIELKDQWISFMHLYLRRWSG